MISQMIGWLMVTVVALCALFVILLTLHLATRNRPDFGALSLFCNRIIPASTVCLTISGFSLFVTSWELGKFVNIAMVGVTIVATITVLALAVMCVFCLIATYLLYWRFERYVRHNLDNMNENQFISAATSYLAYVFVGDYEFAALMRAYILRLAVKLGFCDSCISPSVHNQ